jgi:uncharacterized LabA/DUF88 family protein
MNKEDNLFWDIRAIILDSEDNTFHIEDIANTLNISKEQAEIYYHDHIRAAKKRDDEFKNRKVSSSIELF